MDVEICESTENNLRIQRYPDTRPYLSYTRQFGVIKFCIILKSNCQLTSLCFFTFSKTIETVTRDREKRGQLLNGVSLGAIPETIAGHILSPYRLSSEEQNSFRIPAVFALKAVSRGFSRNKQVIKSANPRIHNVNCCFSGCSSDPRSTHSKQ